MAKRNIIKKKSSPVKDFFREFLEKSVEILLSLIEKINVTEYIKDILHLKSKIRKYTIILILSITALTVLMLGVASYIASQIPKLGNGVGEILVGLILAIVTLIYYKMR